MTLVRSPLWTEGGIMVGKLSALDPYTLAWLEKVYFSKGYKAAEEAFQLLLPDIDLRSYHLQRPGQGQLSRRTDIQTADGISYRSYNAPALWDVPYSLLRVRLENVPKTDFMYHGGEELLTPIAGCINYHFYCNVDGEPPRRQVLDSPLEPGCLVRINPQLPHHIWAESADGAEAWMVIRHLGENASAISVNYELAGADIYAAPRRARAKDLFEPGRYALVAWGLAEKLRLCRERANLKVSQVALACDIDPALLTRIENADTDISIDTLVRIAKILHVSIDSLITPAPWNYRIFPLPQEDDACHHSIFEKPPDPDHLLHPSYWSIPAGQAVDLACPELKSVTSWIVLAGRIIVEIKSGSRSSPELLEQGSVIHFRNANPTRIQALEDSRILQVIFSGTCVCLAK
jgi:transcriptional regulator with XRE-family HTH domain